MKYILNLLLIYDAPAEFNIRDITGGESYFFVKTREL